MQSIFSVLSSAFSTNAAPVATTAMRELSTAEVTAVAGAPELGHDLVPYAAATITVAAKA
ncbi:hypothetical protein [Massilia sp. Root351]|uniref:hypothetical protein n=1 Tax=Massilia sp. Root351 TaxID=1736522 RepID=UPI0012F63FE9|nr:hypothetical protein [Massilia sp. Root351]